MSRETRQHIAGYLIGGSVFLVLVPSGLFAVSRCLDPQVSVPLGHSPALRHVISAVLLVIGLSFGVWSNVVLNTRGGGGPLEFPGVEISPRTRSLVTTGPYRYTRNPMLFGTCTLYYGVAVFLDSVVSLVLVTVFMALMLVFVRFTEERRLSREFGVEYEEYLRRVSMLVPWPGNRPGPPMTGRDPVPGTTPGTDRP